MRASSLKTKLLCERDNLVEKIDRLRVFIGSNPIFSDLPADEKQRMARQHDVMREYANILNERIGALPK